MIKRGQELIAKAVEALGAGSKLDQLRSFQRTDLRGNQVKNILVLAFPDAVRQETIRPNFTLTSVITPSESFVLVNNARQADAGSQPHGNLQGAKPRSDCFCFERGLDPDFKASLAEQPAKKRHWNTLMLNCQGSLQR